jgi:hypothetical protein
MLKYSLQQSTIVMDFVEKSHDDAFKKGLINFLLAIQKYMFLIANKWVDGLIKLIHRKQ